jgi:drug/metabolite transporter (DMT)-like permease
MNKGTILGLILLIGGIVIWAIYSLILTAGEIMQVLNLETAIVGGLIILGIILIFASVIIDRAHEHAKTKEKIPKEDFEP